MTSNLLDRKKRPHKNWLAHFMNNHKQCKIGKMKSCGAKLAEGDASPVMQQSDYLKEFMLEITNNGLKSAYDMYGDNPPGPGLPAPPVPAVAQVSTALDVIVVGAGMAGLVAAYELKRAGLNVLVLEATNRVSGRVHTFSSQNSNFADGLYGEAGAMRIPGADEPDIDDPNRYENSTHFLTDFYIKKFKLETMPFLNYDPNGISNIYGLTAKTTEWEEKYFLEVWPDWADNIQEPYKSTIKTIGEYYNETTGIVTKQLETWLARSRDVDDEIATWERWIAIWNQFTLEGFLLSSLEAILTKIPNEADQEGLKGLKFLLPWPNDALRGYSVSTYTPQLDLSLVELLRDQMGHWWSENMHHIKGGMDSLGKAFAAEISKLPPASTNDILFGHTVDRITYTFDQDDPSNDTVKVSYTSFPDGIGGEVQRGEYTTKAVIVTAPVNILRQIIFEQDIDGPDSEKHPPKEFSQAIEDIFMNPSTKLFLQTKKRFWEDPPYEIKGGFSKSNLPIGQIHYVSPEIPTQEKGMILVYTWKNEAMLFGSMPEKLALASAVGQISTIHPEITSEEKGYDDVGIVHAWYDQPAAQGAFGLIKPRQYDNVRYLWYPMGNVHFAGETISFAAGWIQGAFESGLKSAYQVYCRKQEDVSKGCR